ncbi:MAG: hypothetical protein AB2796_13630 [Candidatus Thiodiazotropha sp.]
MKKFAKNSLLDQQERRRQFLSIFFFLVLFIGLSFMQNTVRAEQCDLYTNYILISEEGFDNTTGLGRDWKYVIDSTMAEAKGNTRAMSQKLEPHISMCYRGFYIAKISELARVGSLSIDADWWTKVESNYRGKKQPEAIKKQIDSRMEKICQRSQLYLADVAAQMPVILAGRDDDDPETPSSWNMVVPAWSGGRLDFSSSTRPEGSGSIGELLPPSSEKVINVYIIKCRINYMTDNVNKLKGLAHTGSIIDVLRAAGSNMVSGAVGRVLIGNVVSRRAGEASFLRGRRLGVQVTGFASMQDEHLLHEVGHYLGLSHLGDQGYLGGTVLCNDQDASDSSVLDTPAGVPSLSDDYNGMWYQGYADLDDRTKWPDSCNEVVLPDGTIDKKIPLRNVMNSGGNPKWRHIEFSQGQYDVMSHMTGLLE